jgi:hypothetical protein
MRREVVLHPILLGLYTIIFASAHMDVAPPGGAILLWLALCAGGAALLSGLLALVSGDTRKSAIAVSVLIVMVFSYGHLKNMMTGPFFDALASVRIGPLKILACTWAAVWVSLAIWLNRASRHAAAIATVALNRAGLALAIAGALNLAADAYASGHQAGVRRPDVAAGTNAAPDQADARNQHLPDIYYIVLDDYGRSDILKDLYHYDNGALLEWLRAKGFYVADESHSNYSQTMLSVASSLNSAYLDPIQLTSAASAGSGARWRALNWALKYLPTSSVHTRRPLADMIQQSSVALTLRQHGYSSVALTSASAIGIPVPDSDVVLQARVLDQLGESLIATTPVPDVLERVFDQLEPYRRRVRYVLDHLADRSGSDQPLFVFAHILCPHPPFAFQPDGTAVPPGRALLSGNATNAANREAIAHAYSGQVQFVNGRIESVIDTILAHARRQTIIVLQGDHGPDMTLDQSNPSAAGIRERMSILNAYYVPHDVRARLYPSITPVNTFRVILGRYFPGAYGLLPDESYYSSYDSPYELVPVNEAIRSGDLAASLR